jgi:hypothetical protein
MSISRARIERGESLQRFLRWPVARFVSGRVADHPEAADAELQRTPLEAGDRRVARVTGDPQAGLAGLGGLVAEGFLEELVVCEVMAVAQTVFPSRAWGAR